jgi:fructose-bisphosphate aldolase, class I
MAGGGAGSEARTSMEAGATGLIFGRNVWKRPKDRALAITERARKVLAAFSA